MTDMGLVLDADGVTPLHGDGENDDTSAIQRMIDGGTLVRADA